jgi:hypothetical protein
VAVAIHTGANRIITLNLKHFPPEALKGTDVTAQHPDAFLIDLYQADPVGMIATIVRQAGLLRKPPITVIELLAKIKVQAPMFAAVLSDVDWDEGD